MRIRIILTLACGIGLYACGGQAPEAPEPEGETLETPEPAAAPAAPPAAAMPRKPAPEGARVYFIAPGDGEQVNSPFDVLFGLSGIGVAPAGFDLPATGHHHLLVDTDVPPEDLPIPTDERHIHFGLGQTETRLELAPGEHTLQLVLGDYLHIPHDPPLLSERITVTVVE